MDKKMLGLILQIVGGLLGGVATILLLKWNKLLVGVEVFGAMLYFVGKYLKKG
jgi:hypothetical protein